MRFRFVLAGLTFALGLGAASAQEVAFPVLRTDTTAQVEVTADSLSVHQADGSAVFTGNVLIVQGPMRLKAERVEVEYGADRSKIAKLHAPGGVTLVSDKDAAEARDAIYEVAAGSVELTGDVLLTQGQNVLSGQRMTIDLKTGTGRMDGRVRTILQPGGTP
ncbi:lipopolysaccharide transport periplasmic protein LptA [Rhodobacter capsulatus]|uniref:lipopolysaccharide transport periplasmic protein LptA n=1 Tax=Rhodobacter capsulatus TaxID=1061 RepID=UPI004028B760